MFSDILVASLKHKLHVRKKFNLIGIYFIFPVGTQETKHLEGVAFVSLVLPK